MKKATIIFGSTTGNTEIVADKIAETMTGYDVQAVSYTHLDVYKRQGMACMSLS